ncbi:MAG TPA: DegV family protein [Anaerolineae bacterium]|nr:DegV family protein [Anaerolineae bacterium]
MGKIAVVTDTDSSLPPALAARYDIRQAPINIHFGQEEFQAGVNLSDAELFARIDVEKKLPTTSAPTPGQFHAVYQAAFEAGAESILCFCVSSEISATYKVALAAREMFPDRDIEVVDSRTLSMAQGFMAMAAAEAVEAGATKEAALKVALGVGERSRVYAALATLKYLAMSGRVGHLAAGMAGLLNIKPLLTVKDGKLAMLEKVRTHKKAWHRVIELTALSFGGKPAARLAIIHANAPEDAQEFLDLLRAEVACPESVEIVEFTPGLSVHAGAGLVGVCAVAAE